MSSNCETPLPSSSTHQVDMVSVTFRWNFGGTNVVLVGTFCEWKNGDVMERIGDQFVVERQLERDKHFEYKFIVDNNWRFAPDQPTVKDAQNNINNYIDTTSEAQEVRKVEENKLTGLYTQEYCSDLTSLEPDPLPPHLQYVLANHSRQYDYRGPKSASSTPYNKQTNAQIAGEDRLPPNELPVPPHVVLSHTAIRANDRLLGMSLSQRYRGKYVTIIYYKPAAFVGK